MTPTDWDAFINELDEEPLSVSDLLALDIASMPEGIVLTILDNDFPEASVWKEGDQLTTEISEHLYTKYWWHKFSAPVFAEALRRAVTRLSGEGHPFSAQEVESDDEVHLWVRWQVRLPPAARAETVVESIRIAFEMVWERAEAILRDSDSVLLLGKDTGPGLARLTEMQRTLEGLGYHVYIVKEQPDKFGESVIQKVLRFALAAKFVLVENTEPSGHLYEIPHVAKLAECVTVFLQETGRGATWMFEDAYLKHRHWHKIEYLNGTLLQATRDAAKWAEGFVATFTADQKRALPWLTQPGTP